MTSQDLQHFVYATFGILIFLFIVLEMTGVMQPVLYWSSRIFVAVFSISVLLSIFVIVFGGAYLIVRAL